MITILLSTYNGEKYLKEQIDSLFNQTYQDISIIVRDDGSSDNTLEILNDYKLVLLKSSGNIGVKKSFSLLLEYAMQNKNSKYFMFCDQDDVWKKDKVEKTLLKMQDMERVYQNNPLLVHTDLKVVDDKLTIINNSFWEHEYIMPQLNNLNRLLMQNTITGCTMMINKELANLALPVPTESIMHDWWIGLVASKFGKIGVIEKSLIQYRQHSTNSIGAKGFSYRNILQKVFDIFLNRNLDRNYLYINIIQAKVFLKIYKDKLDQNNIDMLIDFINIDNKSFLKKRHLLLKHKLLKQGLIRNIGLFLKI